MLLQVSDNHLQQHIVVGVTVTSADWDEDARSWTVVMSVTSRDGTTTVRRLRCSVLFMCSGYFSYDTPHDPKFPGFDKFKGTTLHPQFWPQPCPPLQGKRVVVVGSGATAMTIVPALAKNGVRVTMLQRSPTYVLCRDDRDPVANFLGRLLPAKLAYSIVRWKNVTLQQVCLCACVCVFVRVCDAAEQIFYRMCRQQAHIMKQHMVGRVLEYVALFPPCGYVTLCAYISDKALRSTSRPLTTRGTSVCACCPMAIFCMR